MFNSKGSLDLHPTIPIRLGVVLALLVGMFNFTTASATDDTWSPLGAGMNEDVYVLAFDSHGDLYVGGNFTSAGGSGANHIAKWDGSAWSPLGSGMNGSVSALAFDSSGNLYAGGSFTTAGGLSASRIAKWNGSTWSALGSGVGGTSAEVNALAVDDDGHLFAGGNFTTAGGAAANRIAKWNGTSWSALGDGTGGRVYAITFDSEGDLYAGGSFTTAGGVTANRIAKWNGSVWSALGSGVSNTVRTLVVDGSDHLYAGGGFATIVGGATVNHIAKWDGTTWSAMGSGVSADVYALAADGSGDLYAGGEFTNAGVVLVSRVAHWDGSAWSALGSGLDNTGRALAFAGSGDLIAGGSFVTAGGVTTNRIANWGISAPDDFNLVPSSAEENWPAGTVVGAFIPVDPDPGATFTYSLVTGIGSSDNASFSISDDELLTAAAFDYETRSSYTVRVRSTSSGGSYYEKAFAITVADVSEPPVITEGASVDVSMDENGSPTAFSLTLHATDENVATLAWSISSPASHGTASASGTGASKSIGYAPQTDYTGTDSFVVEVEDSSSGSDTITVNVTILPADAASIEPGTGSSLFCTAESTTVSITFSNVADLFGYQLIVHYDPSLVSATGAFVNTFFNTGASASIPSGWNASCSSGECKFAASKVEPGTPVTGSGAVAQVTLIGLSAGTFDITLSEDILSDREAQVIAHTKSSLHLTVCGFAAVSGTISLQGRTAPVNVGQVTLTDLGGYFGPYSASFDPSTGAFTISSVKVMPGGSSYQFDAAHGLYLGNRTTHTLNPLDSYTAPSTRLLGGDANIDGSIDISDLTCIGGSFGGAPVTCGTTGSSDVNADSAVNILDLVLSGGNYGLTAPRTW